MAFAGTFGSIPVAPAAPHTPTGAYVNVAITLLFDVSLQKAASVERFLDEDFGFDRVALNLCR